MGHPNVGLRVYLEGLGVGQSVISGRALGHSVVGHAGMFKTPRVTEASALMCSEAM